LDFTFLIKIFDIFDIDDGLLAFELKEPNRLPNPPRFPAPSPANPANALKPVALKCFH
jgi:hypothetical protein